MWLLEAILNPPKVTLNPLKKFTVNNIQWSLRVQEFVVDNIQTKHFNNDHLAVEVHSGQHKPDILKHKAYLQQLPTLIYNMKTWL